MQHLREYKDQDKFNIGEFFRELQSKIIIQFAIGGENEYMTELPYEEKDGTKK